MSIDHNGLKNLFQTPIIVINKEAGMFKYEAIKGNYLLKLSFWEYDSLAFISLKNINPTFYLYDISIDFFKEIRCTENSFIITMQNCHHIYEVKFEPHFTLSISDKEDE